VNDDAEQVSGHTGETSPVVDGGAIQDLQSASVRLPPGYSSEVHYDGKRRGWIAFTLFVLLGLLVCGHYAVTVVLVWNGKEDIKAVETAFTTSLPVLSGLAGTAAAFYFRDRDRK
jgi:hypothetical protein